MSSQTAEIIDDEKYLPENPWICNIPVLIAVIIFVLDIWQAVSLLQEMNLCGF